MSVGVQCDKKLLNTPSPTSGESNYFTSEYAFKTAIVGAYASLTDYYSSSNETQGGAWEGEVTWLPGDDLTNGTGQPYEDFSGLNPSGGPLSDLFNSSYILLARVNIIISQLRTVGPGVFRTPGLQNANLGEMLFLRAFAHYQLWNVFGTAPLDTAEVTSLSQENAPSTGGTQLLDQAISDLTAAAPLLPASWDAADLGRVTANSAYGLLGKCLVFRASVNKSQAEYQAALAAFAKITGASLVANYEDNFNVNTENNSESLFEFQAGAPLAGLGATNAWLANDQANIGVASSYWQCFAKNGAGTYMGGNEYFATSKLVGIFDPADPRRPLTLNVKDSSISKYVLNDKPEGAVNSLNNVRILRYADVLLLEAEATIQSGGSPATAIGYINQVRQRARNMVAGGTVPADLDVTATDPKTIMQWIMDERLRELSCEGSRWYDLRRWALGGTVTLSNAFFSSQEPQRMGYDAHFLNFPIPLTETSKDPNIKQNPGY